tara:strand:+ start:220 stop:1332 length:1113 start_codon:yes stop_codon:yes gene_type:complete
MKKIFRCKKCLTPSTRPRVTFDKNKICNACQNHLILKKFNWGKRFKELIKIADSINKKTTNQKYNCVVPVGGGKDSSYVAWKVKNVLGLRPLCVFCEPPLFTKIGKKNIINFKKSGFDLITLKNKNYFRDYDQRCLKKIGIPQQAWLTAITIYPIKIAIKYNIKYIFDGEEPESSYGGSNKNFLKKFVKLSEIQKFLLEGQQIENYYKGKKLKNFQDIYLTKKEIKKTSKISKIYWSSWEFWDEKKHFKIAKEKCGLMYTKKADSNAINNHSHTDQKLYALHMFLAYLKFGFSRATTDASIAIRLGYINRKKGLNLVKKYDHIFPREHLNDYLRYFKLTKLNFYKHLKSFINKKIFANSNLFDLKLKKKF